VLWISRQCSGMSNVLQTLTVSGRSSKILDLRTFDGNLAF
jgi:hypothetical protein